MVGPIAVRTEVEGLGATSSGLLDASLVGAPDSFEKSTTLPLATAAVPFSDVTVSCLKKLPKVGCPVACDRLLSAAALGKDAPET